MWCLCVFWCKLWWLCDVRCDGYVMWDVIAVRCDGYVIWDVMAMWCEMWWLCDVRCDGYVMWDVMWACDGYMMGDVTAMWCEMWFRLYGVKCVFVHRLYARLFTHEFGLSQGPEMIEDIKKKVWILQRPSTGRQSACFEGGGVRGTGSSCVLHAPDGTCVSTHCPRAGKRMTGWTRGGGGWTGFKCAHLPAGSTDSVAGGLPLGCIITTTENESTVLTGLIMLQEIWPLDAFDGQGPPKVGPAAVILTDDNKGWAQRPSPTFSPPPSSCSPSPTSCSLIGSGCGRRATAPAWRSALASYSHAQTPYLLRHRGD